MPTDPQPATLDPLRFPLWGSRLIEASAGTGKTWTIAALYLRLVLGHGVVHADAEPDAAPDAAADTGFGRPLLPSEILVMTFTRAATRELSDRIRARLLEAARCFRGETDAAAHDPLLAALLADYPAGPVRSAAAWRLALAAEAMDDAAVHTIDAWCQRMLREHAFDSGSLFDEELAANERALQDEAAHDYWRQQLYPLDGAGWDAALAVWPGVDALADDARALLDQPLPAGAGQGTLGALIAGLGAERQRTLAALKQGWVQRAAAMQAWLDDQCASKTCPFNKVKLAQRHYTAWLAALAGWASAAAADADADTRALKPALKTGATRLTPEGLLAALKPGAWVELPDDFAALATLLAALDALPPLRTGLRLHAAARIAARLDALKQQSGSFGFADLLHRLDRALDPGVNGAAAERLRARMLAQTPVALVDEFQDTAPVQARIFDRLYRIAENRRATALLLIGDPKQSIYGFRGADIHSYLGAREATAGRHAVLGTNHRSTRALVDAVNHLFVAAEQRAGAGAFLFRGPVDGAGHAANPLPFVPVGARGRPEALVSAAGPEPALRLVLDSRLRDGQSSQRLFAARCAEQIVALLNDPQAGFAVPATGLPAEDTGFAAPGAAFRRLRPADIAVLVRTGREAAAVRAELRRRRVASVYLSDKDSVFASAEAADLLRWLRAVAAPLDMRLARAALATATVGLSIAELRQLATDELAFDARSEQLRQLHGIWQTQGVLSMLRQTLHRLDLPARWLADADDGAAAQGAGLATDSAGTGGTAATDAPPAAASAPGSAGGERRLTNMLHLAELLQTASAQLDGEQALIRWLAAQIDGAAAAGEAQIVRLESDADLVQVVTVHKSKGLEYPLVFLPFATAFRPVKPRTPFVSLAESDGSRTLALAPTADQIAAADEDRLREDLRLLYVALTRARHALWVGVAALKSGQSSDCTAHRSALGRLLCGPDLRTPEALAAQIADQVAGCDAIALQPAAAIGPLQRLQPRGQPVPLRALQPYGAEFERRWTVGSFSGLVRDLAQDAAGVPALDLARPAFSPSALRDDEGRAPASDARSADEFGAATEPAAGAGRSAAALAAPADLRPANGPAATASAVADAADPVDPQPWHRFPRGALAGNFLHDQLEWLAGEGFGLAGSPALQLQLVQRCARAGWGARSAAVQAWLQAALRSPLPPLGCGLDGLVTLLPEMEFWLPSAALHSADIDALCRSHLLGGRARPALPERSLRGMLMGFADLVFEHQGRYWVLDHKSNQLGPQDADYSADALEAAMAAHRYDVQAAIYLLALHRLLRARLGPAYDPARQLGGALFFFLRGIDGPVRGCHWVSPPPALLDGLDALLDRAEETLP